MESYDEDVGELQGVMITARHGDNHLKYARPYLDLGIPMFIDKPVTVTEADAWELRRKLSSLKIKVTGGSSLRQDKSVRELKAEREQGGSTLGGFVRAPIQMRSVWGGFYFYAPHLIEILCEVFGRYPERVTARRFGEDIKVTFGYPGCAVEALYEEGGELYSVERTTEGGTRTVEIKSDVAKDWLLGELREYHGLLLGGGMTLSYEELFAPVYIAAAIERAYETGITQRIRYPEPVMP